MRFSKLFRLAAFAIGAGLIARRIARGPRTFSFKDSVVVIAGGSRGLGLVLARMLAKEGAQLALLARNPEELKIAAADLYFRWAEVMTYPCDISNKAQVDAAIAAIVHRFGRIDVLINDAGVIEVGPFETMTVEDFRECMDIHFWGPLHLVQAVLPNMKQRRRGRIVNISSIGGKVSVPHLLPYCTSKFALTAFSEGLRAELLKENIFVTTVCPGMMRTGSHVNAYFKGHNHAEYAWFSVGNALPFTSVSAEQAARQIITAVRRGEPELIISWQAQLMSKVEGLMPGFTSDALGLVNRFLPGPNGNGTAKFTGWQSRSRLVPSFLTSLSDRQIPLNNEG